MGIQGAALEWKCSYLSDRTQCVCINGKSSGSVTLTHGVPQGSVLGPVLFTMYITPLGDLVREHRIKFHAYADDSQDYISFSADDKVEMGDSVSRIKNLLRDTRFWMILNMLGLNGDKTESAILGTRQHRQNLD